MQSSGREQTGEATTINVHGGTQTLATARRRRKTQPGAEARDRPAGGCHGVQHGEALQGTAPRRGRRTGVTLVTDASMISFLNGRRKMARYLMLNSTSPVRDLMTPSVTSSSSKRSTCPSTHCHRFIFPRKSNTDTDRQEERDTNTQTHLHHVAAVHILAFHFVFELLLQCLQQLRTEKSRVDGHGMHQLLLHTPASAGSTPRNEDGKHGDHEQQCSSCCSHSYDTKITAFPHVHDFFGYKNQYESNEAGRYGQGSTNKRTFRNTMRNGTP